MFSSLLQCYQKWKHAWLITGEVLLKMDEMENKAYDLTEQQFPNYLFILLI